MGGGKLKELAASAAGKVISSTNTAGATAESLSSLFLSTLKKSSAVATKEKSENCRAAEGIATQKKCVSSFFGSGLASSSVLGAAKKAPSEPPCRVSSRVLSVLKEPVQVKKRDTPVLGNKSVADFVLHITSALQGETGSLKSPQSEETTYGGLIKNSSHDTPIIFKSHIQKERSRERKARWTHKNTQDLRLSRLIKRSADTLGTESTLEVLSKLGKETGVKEYNALIGICIDKARQSNDEDTSLVQIQKASQLVRNIIEHGFQIEEESYRNLLLYLIEEEMVEEFKCISGMIKNKDPQSNSRICYYQMLLWIRIGNEEKIQSACNSLRIDDDNFMSGVAENYLLAFCESDRKNEILDLLKVLDIRNFSSQEYVSTVLKSLGRQSLENVAIELILALKSADESKWVSSLIFDYTSNVLDLAVEEVISKFQGLHEKLKVEPSSQACDKLIVFCCNSFKVHAARDPILRGTEDICEIYWVHQLWSMARMHNLKMDRESAKSMISVYLMLKDFEGAYNLLAELKEMKMDVDTGMYNSIMIGYFKEKNIYGGLMVLKQMKDADIKPDSETFSYLISNCECEEDIDKFLEEMKHFQVEFTKQIYIALVNAYTNCGRFDQAKQVIMDTSVPAEHINDIKRALVSAFSLKGNISDAVKLYDGMKQAGCKIDPIATANIIGSLNSEGQIDRLLELLAELEDDNSCLWFEACGRVVLYCVRNNLLSSAVDLLVQLKFKDKFAACTFIDQMFCQIWEVGLPNLEVGMALLQAVKDDLGLHPSRTSLDFLLGACVKMKDLKSARLVWAEYSKAGLPFNVITYLRMYQAFLASGDFKGAERMLKRISRDDKHVQDIVKACKIAYGKPMSLCKHSSI